MLGNPTCFDDETGRNQTPPAPANFRDWKHSLQKTGRPCVGRNGTVVPLPQAEHVVTVSIRSRVTGPPDGRLARLLLQALHRLGSFLKFLSAKNCCSPAVQTNSAPQSTHLRIRSWNSIGRYLVGVARLLQLAPELLAIAFARQRLLRPALVAGLQIEGVLLDVLDDVLLLNLPLESAEGALDRLTLLNLHFGQRSAPPNPRLNRSFRVLTRLAKHARLSQVIADS